MDQKTFDMIKAKVEKDIREHKKKITPSESITVLSPMQQDAGMGGHTPESLVNLKVSARLEMEHIVNGASLTLRYVAEQYGLKYNGLEYKQS